MSITFVLYYYERKLTVAKLMAILSTGKCVSKEMPGQQLKVFPYVIFNHKNPHKSQAKLQKLNGS